MFTLWYLLTFSYDDFCTGMLEDYLLITRWCSYTARWWECVFRLKWSRDAQNRRSQTDHNLCFSFKIFATICRYIKAGYTTWLNYIWLNNVQPRTGKIIKNCVIYNGRKEIVKSFISVTLLFVLRLLKHWLLVSQMHSITN